MILCSIHLRLLEINIHFSCLRITNRVVRIKLELGKAQSDLEHWKATQLSPQFAHVSHAARAKLDNIRKSYDTQVSDAKKRLSHALATLVELPELSRIMPKVFNPDLDGQKVIAYTEELKDWIVDLRKHLIAITILRESPQPPQRERQDSYEDGQIDSSPSVKRQRLDHEDRPLWTWDDLKSHVSQLEDKIAQAADQLDEAKIFRAFTNLSDIVNETAEEQRRATVAKRGESFVDPVLELSQRADGLGDELGNQASLSAGLLLKIHTGEQTIKLLEVQKQEHEVMKAQVRGYPSNPFLCSFSLLCERSKLNSHSSKNGVKKTRNEFAKYQSKSRTSRLVLDHHHHKRPPSTRSSPSPKSI